MSDQSGAAAQDASRNRPDRLSLRHSKLEAKRRLAGGEFTTLHDAQLAVAREHGMSSWAALKEHIAAFAAAEPGYALAQVRWLFRRYAEAGAPGWTAPSRDELSEHFTEQLLGLAPPEMTAAILAGLAPKLREDLVLVDADPLYLNAKVADLLVEAHVEPEAPHETLLVLDATVGRNALAQENIFGNQIGVSGIVMTKLDGTARGGVLVPVAQASDSPIKLVGVGEGVDDLQPFDARAFARSLVGLEDDVR